VSKILVIEDEPTLFRLLDHKLKKAGYVTIWAKDGEEALELLKSEKPDLVVSDVMIPYISGLEVLKQAKEDPDTCDIPFIFLSAKGQDADILAGLELGSEDYITKPFNPDEVLIKIQRILKRTKAR
jgi:DNA-binding response OmpR family regulator